MEYQQSDFTVKPKAQIIILSLTFLHVGWVEKYADPRNHWDQRGQMEVGSLRMRCRTKGVPLLLSESKCWEGIERKQKGLVSTVLRDDTSWSSS